MIKAMKNWKIQMQISFSFQQLKYINIKNEVQNKMCSFSGILLFLSVQIFSSVLGVQYFKTNGFGAVPFDTCVITGDGPSIFTCSDDGTTVTQLIYDYSITDVSCGGSVDSTVTYGINDAEFSCTGHISYSTISLKTDFFGTCNVVVASTSLVNHLCVDIAGVSVKLSMPVEILYFFP